MQIILSPEEYNETCPISFETYKNLASKKNMGLVVTSCGHRFCKIDISLWIKKKIDKNETPTCPVCIKKINKKLVSIKLAKAANTGTTSLSSKSIRDKINGNLDEKGALNLALRISGNVSGQNKSSNRQIKQDTVNKYVPKKTINHKVSHANNSSENWKSCLSKSFSHIKDNASYLKAGCLNYYNNKKVSLLRNVVYIKNAGRNVLSEITTPNTLGNNCLAMLIICLGGVQYYKVMSGK